MKAEKNRLKKKPTTSKLLLVAVIVLSVEIVIFSQYVMIKFQDLTALYTLIGVPVTLVPVALGYYNKSKAENTIGGVTYETAVHQMGIDNGIDTGVNCVEENNEEYIDINKNFNEPNLMNGYNRT